MSPFLANSIGGSHRRQRNHPLHVLAVAGSVVEPGSKTLATNLICKKKLRLVLLPGDPTNIGWEFHEFVKLETC